MGLYKECTRRGHSELNLLARLLLSFSIDLNFSAFMLNQLLFFELVNIFLISLFHQGLSVRVESETPVLFQREVLDLFTVSGFYIVLYHVPVVPEKLDCVTETLAFLPTPSSN
jgi:hypothetical protein